MERVQRLGPADGEHLDTLELINQHVPPERVGNARSGSQGPASGALAPQTLQHSLDFRRTAGPHQLERPGLEAEREATAELEVGRGADPPIEDVDRLRKQDPEQAVADRPEP